jgi:hypothetical protein
VLLGPHGQPAGIVHRPDWLACHGGEGPVHVRVCAWQGQGMATLERRVPILFDSRQYDSLRQLAQAEGRSVGSIVREAVDLRLSARQTQRRSVAERLIAGARDQRQDPTPDWNDIKAGFDCDHLAGIE